MGKITKEAAHLPQFALHDKMCLYQGLGKHSMSNKALAQYKLRPCNESFSVKLHSRRYYSGSRWGVCWCAGTHQYSISGSSPPHV